MRIIDAELSDRRRRRQPRPDGYRLITTLLDHRLPRRRSGPAVPRALGDRVRLPGPAPHPAQRPRPALGGPARRRAGAMGAAHPLPAAAHGDGHRGGDPARYRPRPGQLHHRRSRPRARNSPRPRESAPTAPPDLLGVIGRAVLATLLPARRPRFSARKVKCATSRYLNRDDGRPATPPPSPRSTSPCAPHPSARAGTRRCTPARPRPTAATHPKGAIMPSSPASPREPGAASELALRLHDQAPQHAHTTRRMDPPRLLHPHRLRHLCPQHAALPRALDNRARPLTSRPCTPQGRGLDAGGGRRILGGRHE